MRTRGWRRLAKLTNQQLITRQANSEADPEIRLVAWIVAVYVRAMSDPKHLWAPWRSAFVLGDREKGCVFCNRLKEIDSVKNLVLYRGELNFIIMNKYPYNSGHLLVVPNRHTGVVEKLRPNEAAEFFHLTQLGVRILKKVLKPQSLNLGMNLGRISGAGVPGHLHMHIVPRWTGDTNFMPIVGKTKVLSIPLEPIYKRLRAAFDAV